MTLITGTIYFVITQEGFLYYFEALVMVLVFGNLLVLTLRPIFFITSFHAISVDSVCLLLFSFKGL